jgi:hypothetical protein
VKRTLLLAVVFALTGAAPADARSGFAPETKLELKARTTPISWRWAPILDEYTGGSYNIGYVNQLWPHAPHGTRRRVAFRAAVQAHIPVRLLLGIWGAESSFGRAASHFGLTGWFPGRGTSGSFDRDAVLAAGLLDHLYRSRWGRRAL